MGFSYNFFFNINLINTGECIMDSTVNMPTVVNPTSMPQQSVYVIERDQSTLKGILWGFLAFKLGGVALSAGAATLITSPFVVTPAAPVPVIFGLATYLLACGTKASVENACYHLGSRSIVVVQPANVVRLQQF